MERIQFRLRVSISNWCNPNRVSYASPLLVVDAVSQIYRTDSVIYTIPLAPIDHNEVMLCDGRFAYYVPDTQEHQVSFYRKGMIDPSEFTDILDWMGEQVDSDWSLSARFDNVGEGWYNWSFANATDAIKFKLTWP